MTNKEFYGDKLLAVTLKGNCHKLYKMAHGKGCEGLECKDCEFEFGETKEGEIENILQWLNAEHEEPLLANGDGLKTGDWIMVRDEVGHAWKKRRFMCFHRGMFITSDNSSIDLFGKGTHSDWEQARLPKKGE